MLLIIFSSSSSRHAWFLHACFCFFLLLFLFLQVTTDVLTRDGKDIAFGDYGPTWRFHRKIVHRALCMFGEGSASIEKIGV